MIDLSKAFDAIIHSLLLDKLEACGIHGTELKWFSDYLSRRQRVVINGAASDWKIVTQGVQQGSILCPLLFTLFVNDMPDVVKHCTINQYADDTTIYTSDKDPDVVESTLEELKRVSSWVTANGLRMKVAKIQPMVLSRRGKQQVANTVKVSIGDVELTKLESVKYLAMVVDRCLNWCSRYNILH